MGRPLLHGVCPHCMAVAKLSIDGLVSEQAEDQAGKLIGVVICKLEPHRGGPMRGYIAMLAVEKEHRGKGIATKLVSMAVDAMIEKGADEVCTESSPGCVDYPTDLDYRSR